jgi:hypothetical protein
MTRRGMFRPRNVTPGDVRSPMRRLLEDGQCNPPGFVAVVYAAQWPTLIKAQRLGYLDDRQFLTDAGRAFLASRA